jgi:hypothetical protein
MAEPTRPSKVKLFIGIIFSDESKLLEAQKVLKKKFGDIDFQTRYLPFNHTSYYKNMGDELYKVFYSFNRLISREGIVNIKLFTNRLEKKLSEKNKRSINIDPGYMTLSNVFLATCKDYFHRVYLGKGVYLENEYKYLNKQYQSWEWTYPDYLKPEYIFFFHEMRKIYVNQQ